MLSPYCGCYSCRPSDGTSWNLARLFVTCQHSFLLKLPGTNSHCTLVNNSIAGKGQSWTQKSTFGIQDMGQFPGGYCDKCEDVVWDLGLIALKRIYSSDMLRFINTFQYMLSNVFC